MSKKKGYAYLANALGYKGGLQTKYLTEEQNFLDLIKRGGTLLYVQVDHFGPMRLRL